MPVLVLLVEHDPESRARLSRALEGTAAILWEAESVERAGHLVRQALPDLVLCDRPESADALRALLGAGTRVATLDAGPAREAVASLSRR